jgi:hypothetical protein
LAEAGTRDVAYAFQKALLEYDGSNQAYRRIRSARRLFRDALRADLGLGEDIKGRTIYETTAKRQKIGDALKALQAELGIEKTDAELYSG